MAKKKNQTRKTKSDGSRKQRKAAATRETVSRKMRAAPKVKSKVKAQAVKTISTPQPQQKSTGTNRLEGVRCFALAGRPTREQFILVYGERGPKMTWRQRAAAGVPAEQFQATLAAKLAEKPVSPPAAAKSAPTTM